MQSNGLVVSLLEEVEEEEEVVVLILLVVNGCASERSIG